MGRAHVVAIPYPAQGHVIPLMELALNLANNGIRVTFANTESNHIRVMESLPPNQKLHELIDLVSISDGLDSWEDRMDFAKSVEALWRVVPAEVEALIKSINATPQADAVTCILTDVFMAGITQAYDKFSMKTAAFMPGSAALLASTSAADKLLEDGIIDTNGTPLQSAAIRLSASMPEMNPNHFAWVCLPDLHQRRVIFQSVVDNNKTARLAQFVVCNSSPELEAAAIDFTKCLPIGPLLASSRLGKQSGYFWPENPTCLSWLDQQAPNSVVYVAFGSFTVFDSVQFRELALGLELAGKPFLWVVRQDITQDLEKAYPTGFEERVKSRGKMVNWAPQQQVLSHPSIACFVSHCGWNSTVESVSNGVPILCWPYFADQFLNETYIVDHWGVGLSLERDDSGIFRKEEIKKKVEMVSSDEQGYRQRVIKLQHKTLAAAATGGSSEKNLRHFMDWIKKTD